MSSHDIDKPEGDTNEHMISFTLPPFDQSKTLVWLVQVESFFHARRITSQTTMFHTLVSALPPSVVEQLLDVIHPIPPVAPYDTLKEALLKRTSASEEHRLKQLLSGVQLGDRTPSQLLRHMKAIVGDLKIDDALLRQLWCQRLPSTVNAILSVSDSNSTLENLAAIADKIQERIPSTSTMHITESSSSSSADRISRLEEMITQLSSQVNRLTLQRQNKRSFSRRHSRSRTRSTSRSSNRFCRYHRRFGDKARRCIHPCAHPSSVFHHSESGNENAKQ